MPPDEDEKSKDLDAAIHELLDICASREVEVPDGLKRSLLDKEESEKEEELIHASVLSSFLSEKLSLISQFEESELLTEVRKILDDLKFTTPSYDLRVVDGKYTVTNYYYDYSTAAQGDEEAGHKQKKPHYETVMTASFISNWIKKSMYFLKTRGKSARKAKEKVLLDGVNLKFDRGKLYLVLGAPGAGKSTLLRYIADTLRKDKDHIREGSVSLNGISSDDPSTYWSNLCVYIDQIDRLHPYLTVQETLEFAWQCRSGGTHAKFHSHDLEDPDDPDVKKTIQAMDKDMFVVKTVMEALGLTRVKDTFVGNQLTVRGVSGGEKKRVTVAEMLCVGTPVLCCDEISTGLDAATTYDIVKLLLSIGRLSGTIRIVSLLQPPPETVALFDELILVDSGQVIYSGPVDEVVPHFNSLGYKLPDRMDVADWLQALPNRKGKAFLEDPKAAHLSSEEFREKFDSTDRAKLVREELKQPVPKVEGDPLTEIALTHFANKSSRSLWLLCRREMLLWWRDKYQLKARIAQDLMMGIIAGTVFWQQGWVAQSIAGILFQNLFFCSLGAMMNVPQQFETRSIFYKHQDANFFPTWSYVTGRSLAGLPIAVIDGLLFGTIIYWFVGMAGPQNGASISNFFIYLLIMIVVSLSAGFVFSIFSSAVKDKSTAQAYMSITIVILVLFSGFTVQSDIIPNYWIWAYWINLYAWLLRSVNVNEFQSDKWDAVSADGETAGDNILTTFGFTLNGDPFTFPWVWYGIIFAIGAGLMAILASNLFLSFWRFETGTPLDTLDEDENGDNGDNEVDIPPVEIPLQKVNLTFKDIHYMVRSSITKEDLQLLNGVDGFVEAGKMTALMGSSGAGKTTLMDVLALRKSTGEITGEVCLNGHPQDPLSFRRCTGYVEQFDEQQPQLTIRETVEFSAKLRLEETDPAVTPESTKAFIDQTLDMLELTNIQDLQIGSDLTGGLSFEQKKRVSIAAELVSNPSLIFLDEPTSGLDARSASVVMRGLKRIALTGRAVCATIHQPSIAIFNSFDSLLLLKRGGEVVFFGELGDESANLIAYLERYPSTPKIQPGENPATWMLTTIGAGSSGGQVFDYAGSYARSKLREKNLALIDEFCSEATESNMISFPSKYATSTKTQMKAVINRVRKIYWRSPSYNTTRLIVSAAMALLFGSVYASQRTPQNESDMNSRVTTVYITFVFLAVNSTNLVLVVFEQIRNMYYKHEASQMYNSRPLVAAFTISEYPFIALGAMVFVLPFYFLVGFAMNAGKFFYYYFFIFLTMGLFTFLGQVLSILYAMLMSVFRDSVTAQGFGGLTLSFTSMFSGVLIRPQNIPPFWYWAYWTLPGHYILEGLLTTQFKNDNTPIEATPGSLFWEYLVNSGTCSENEECFGTAQEWIYISFGGQFTFDNVKWDIIYLVGVTVMVRVITHIGLTRLNFLAN